MNCLILYITQVKDQHFTIYRSGFRRDRRAYNAVLKPLLRKINHLACNADQAFMHRLNGKKGARNLKEIEVKVIDNDIEKAMRILKKKIQNDGLFKRLKLKKSYEKPSEYRRRKMREALRRERIAAAKARHRR
jgi:small subunit ribosomal protein S21